MKERPIYLDCAATTPIDPRVYDLICYILKEEYGNSGSRTHIWGMEAKKVLERAREQVAAIVDATPNDVIFTSGATESNNLAILGLTDYGLSEDRRHIISTQIEHKAVLEPLLEMERRGFEVTLLPPTSGGWVRPEDIAAALRPDTLLVSVMHVNNETGIIQPIDEICEVLKSHPAYFHSDSAQGFGKELKQPRNKRIDLLSCSGHKICGPKGIGALITRRRNYKRPPIKPLMFGGGQEASLRPGTQPVFLAAGLGFAAQLAFDEIEKRTAHCQKIGDNLIQMFTEYGFQVIGDDRRIPNIVLLAKEGLDSESLMITLKECVAISNGAACSSNNYTKSYVLSAMCIEDDISASVTRWSWGYHTKDESFTRLRTLLNDYLR